MNEPNPLPSPLIDTGRLRALLAEAKPAQPLVLLDARPSADAFAAQHLPGARHAALEQHLSVPPAERGDPSRGGRHPLPEPEHFARQLGEWGVSPSTHVVIYDAGGGDMAAARCWWMLRAGGHDRALVQVLDGGLAAAEAAGLFEVERYAPTPEGRAPYPLRDWSAEVAPLNEVRAISQASALEDPQSSALPILLDARSTSRFRGEGDPFDPVTGRIPGSRNAPFTEALGEDGGFRSREQLRTWLEERLGSAGPEREVVVSCGSGVTACHLALTMEHAGLKRPRVYVGSWSEWCRHPDLPVARGDQRCRDTRQE